MNHDQIVEFYFEIQRSFVKVHYFCEVYGPYFLKVDEGMNVTVNRVNRYRAMIADFLFPKMCENGLADIWLQMLEKVIGNWSKLYFIINAIKSSFK